MCGACLTTACDGMSPPLFRQLKNGSGGEAWPRISFGSVEQLLAYVVDPFVLTV
jgi:hypothetical protein